MIKKPELSVTQWIDLALSKISRGRWQWDGGDQNEYVSNEEVTADPEFWKRLITNRRYALKLREDNPRHPHWLRYARIYWELVLTGGNLKKFWKELLT